MMRAMMNRQQLAELLGTVSVEAVARDAGVSSKTVYRLRHQQTSPRLDVVERLVAAAHRIKAAAPEQPAKAA